MGLPKLKIKISVRDYLEGEKNSQIKHEYLDGEVYAMAGTSKSHNEIIANINERLRIHLRGNNCRSFFTNIKVLVQKLNRYYYPDLIVVCGEDDESEYFTRKPTLIIEILSPSTTLTDRREKMFAYKEIESLREYVMVEQNRMYAEIYRRREDGNLWDWIEFEAGEEIDLASLNFKMPMAEIYAGVELQEQKDWERENR
jgi:Uma2 family endonuclease